MVLAYPDVELLDVAGPVNVLTAATRLHVTGAGYAIELAAAQAGVVTTAGGLGLWAGRALTSLRGPIDTLVVPGGVNALEAGKGVVSTLQRLAPVARRVVGVCSGAFLLAQAGLLHKRRAVTHWAACEAMHAHYPDVQMERDAIFIRDGKAWTSAGVTAGMDLALALVEQDCGPRLALEVARWLVMYLRRPGGQSQYSAPLQAQRAEHPRIQALTSWAQDHLHQDLSVAALAHHAGMSPRNFARVFVAQTGLTPAAWVAQMRLEAARSLLEMSEKSVKEIAKACGYSHAESLHHAFHAAFHIAPRAYRARFSAG